MVLTSSNATVLRGGAYAQVNLSSDMLLVTRSSNDPSYQRRIALTFDTESTIPANTPIASASLVLTVAGGNAETRTISAFRIPTPYVATQATWNRRTSQDAWKTAGGDLAERYATSTVTASAGTLVTFDVTALVQGAVSGRFGGSRYARIALLDQGPSSRESYREYFSDEAADPGVRPRLTVTYAASAPAPAPPPPLASTPAPGSGVRLRVLQVQHAPRWVWD